MAAVNRSQKSALTFWQKLLTRSSRVCFEVEACGCSGGLIDRGSMSIDSPLAGSSGWTIAMEGKAEVGSDHPTAGSSDLGLINGITFTFSGEFFARDYTTYQHAHQSLTVEETHRCIRSSI